ncbi:probable cytochrome P450 12b2, mitochondrial [Bradysia coprophila]|uniref:probable cytochrome P450 12b2, mitochondrial n=1 Tax=Bradysia coprophila TaxID=38358 RepID=UPI00187DD1F2|nr:probable cytochrome P450 12b2, mitochondrial [Bradysia coprophila]
MNKSAKIPFRYGICRPSEYLRKSFATQVSADDEFDNAKPYSEIPGPTLLQGLRSFLPGGKFHNKEPIDMNTLLNKEYGNILRLPGSFGRKDVIITYDPKDFETVFRTEGLWPYRRPLLAVDYCRRKRPDAFKNSGGLINDQGEVWGRMRSAVNPAMLKPKTVKVYIPAIDDVAIDFVTKIKAIADDNHEMPSNFAVELEKWSLESIAVIALEHRLGIITNENDAESQKIIKSVKAMFHLGFKAEVLPPIWIQTPMFKELSNSFNIVTDILKKYVDSAIDRKHNAKDTDDGDERVLEKLLKINPDYVFALAMDMLIAGIDTTSAVVANLLYHLAKNPFKQEKLRDEVMKILPTVDSKLSTTSLGSVPYMRACIKETMRLTPPIPVNMRGTGRNLVLQGYQIPKNTDVAMFGALLHLDDNHFTRSAEFIPERWLSGTDVMEGCPNNGRSDNPFAFLPFGFGSRACIGKRFAEMEIAIVLLRILREFRVEWHYGPLKYVQAFIVTPTNDLKFKMIPLK